MQSDSPTLPAIHTAAGFEISSSPLNTQEVNAMMNACENAPSPNPAPAPFAPLATMPTEDYTASPPLPASAPLSLHAASASTYPPLVPPPSLAASPGTVVAIDKETIVVACESGCLAISELQRNGKKRMAWSAMRQGFSLALGDQFIA